MNRGHGHVSAVKAARHRRSMEPPSFDVAVPGQILCGARLLHFRHTANKKPLGPRYLHP